MNPRVAACLPVAACRAACLIPLISTAAVAQERSAALEEVVVTAQKREEKSQDVPFALTALDAESLEKIGATDFTRIGHKVPALTIEPYYNSSSALRVYLRGVGQENPEQFLRDGGVGIYFDDVYVAHGNGLAMQLLDIERIEVLSGPQGTLYGRNSVGGTVKFISSKPRGEFGIKENLDVGNFGYVRSLTTLDLPTVGGVSAKLTFLKSMFDGWVENTGSGRDFGEKDVTGYRAALRWQPADAFTLDYAFDRSKQEGASAYSQHQYNIRSFGPFSFPTFSARQDTSWRPGNLPIRDDFESSGHSLTALWEMAANTTLKSITAYRDFNDDNLHDHMEAFNLPAVQQEKATQHQFSQELLLSGELPGRLKYHVDHRAAAAVAEVEVQRQRRIHFPAVVTRLAVDPGRVQLSRRASGLGDHDAR